MVGFEVAVEPPDQRSLVLLHPALVIREGVELVHEALGMHPAQRMTPDHELTGIIADDHRLGQEAVCLDRTPERALGGDAHRIGVDLQISDAEPLRCACQAARSGKVCSGCVASRSMSGPDRARSRM